MRKEAILVVAFTFGCCSLLGQAGQTQTGSAPQPNQTTPPTAVQAEPPVAPSRQAAPPPATLEDGFPIPPGTVRISGGVSAGYLLKGKGPAYPEEARKAHIEGAVIFEALINTEGKIVHLVPISGPAMLRQPSLDVVSKWTYRPYVLNGKPVPIETTINVTFTFNQ